MEVICILEETDLSGLKLEGKMEDLKNFFVAFLDSFAWTVGLWHESKTSMTVSASKSPDDLETNW